MNTRLKILFILLLCLSLGLRAYSQDGNVLTGIVLNDAKQPISQVTISIPGTEPVYTGEDGTFVIPRAEKVEWLYATPLEGYKKKEILLTNQKEITIYLTSLDLDSRYDLVLNQGDDMARRDLNASFKTVNTKSFVDDPYTTTEQYLQGRVAGAFVTQNSGMPGAGASMFIRGFSSITTNNQPLYIVDGVPLESASVHEFLIEGNNTSPISSIDPLDITEITVLKDAAATAMYGAKAANGVVVIKTLEPKETKTTIDFMYRTGLSMAPDQLPQLDAKSYKTLANEVLFSSGVDEEVYKEMYPGLYLTPEDDDYITYNHDYNWQDEVFRNAMMHNARFAIKGGDAIAKYGLSVGYMKNEGVIKNTSLDRLNIRLIGAFEIFSWLQMDVASSLTTSTSYLKESALSSITNPILNSLWKSPMLNPYEYDSYRNPVTGVLEPNLLKIIDEVDELGTSNPTAISELSEGKAKNYRFNSSINLRADLGKYFKFNSLVGLNSNTSKEKMVIPDRGFDLMYANEVERESKEQNNSLYSIYNDNKVFFDKESNHKHHYYASLGLRWQTNAYEQDYGYSRNSTSDYYTNLQRGDAVLRQIGGSSKKWNWGALYSNLAYSFADTYLLSATLSGDISSRIGSQASNTIMLGDAPVGIFYAVSGAWRLSNTFLKDVNAIEELKLRASYGRTGNDDVGETNSFSHYKVDQYRSMGVLVPGGLANNALTYQTKDQLNIGLDMSLFANRFYFTIDYFNNKSQNVLMYELQDSYLGYDTYPNNSAAFTTKGIEFEAFTRVVSNPDFKFDLGFNITKSATVLDKVEGGMQVMKGPGYELANIEGESINSFYGYKYLGVYSTSEEAAAANLVNDKRSPYMVGDAIYYNQPDADGLTDNVIDKDDKQVLGSFEPDFYGGIYTNFRYKDFSLNMFFQGVYGNEVFNYVRQQNEKMTGVENQSVKTLQRWQYEGQKTSVPKATWGDPQGNTVFSDRWIEDGSYLRLKSLTLSYDVNRKVLGLSNMKVFATATNVFTLSKYKGYDPEFSYSPSMYYQGIDYANTPVAKQFMIGVRVGL